MRRTQIASFPFALLTMPLALSAGDAESPGDWPTWRGPNRDAISTETGLLSKWPEGGPPLAWQVEGLGGGHSSVAIADGRIFTIGER
ncbi:MAG: hypothetical protein ACREJB_09165, partial [Planctomycetaceae bacterium]